MPFRRSRSESVERRERAGQSPARRLLRGSPANRSFEEAVERAYTPARALSRSVSLSHVSDYGGASSWGVRTAPLSRTASLATISPGPVVNPFFNVTHGIPDWRLHYDNLYHHTGWSYPIWKYLNMTQRHSYALGLASRVSPIDSRWGLWRRYYGYASGEADHFAPDTGRSLDRYRSWRLRTGYAPWYRDYYSDSGLRHFGGFRPRYAGSYIRALWL